MNCFSWFRTMVYHEIINLLTQKGIPFKIHEHEAVRTIEDAEQNAPLLVKKLIKTIAFKVKDDGWVLAGVPCYKRIDYRKVAVVLGINRRQLRSLSPQEVQDELGFEVGGVGPVPTQNGVRVIFDRNLMDAGTIYCGSGKNTRTLELDFADLVRVTGGLIHPITR